MNTNESIKRELLNSLKKNDDAEEQRLNEKANNVSNSQEATALIHRYKVVIKTQNKKAIGYTGKQGELFKTFKVTENFFIMLVKEDRQYILLYKFLKIILKIILKQSRLFANKTQLYLCSLDR